MDQPRTLTAGSIYVGRQAIYDRRLNVSAYELLYRDSLENSANFIDGDAATGQVLLNAFVEIGIDTVVGNQPAFLNASESFIVAGHCQSLPREQVVIEVLEDVTASDEVVEELTQLSEAGYRIALDDFIYEKNLDKLVNIANLIKVDVRQLDRKQVAEHVDLLKHFDVELLAEKVETHEEFEFYKELGFHYFQGYFASRPRVIQGQHIPSDHLTTMQLLARLHDPNVKVGEVETLIRRDPALCFKLLRFINSSFCGVRHNIDSIRHAATLVGLRKLRTWASLLGFGSVKDKPREVIVTANVRARMCEQLATKAKQRDPDRFFTVGLFSLIDAMADRPLQEVLELLPLSIQTKNALMDYSGPLGNTLKCVLAYEAGNWVEVIRLSDDPDFVAQSYLEAVAWTTKMMSDLEKGQKEVNGRQNRNKRGK